MAQLNTLSVPNTQEETYEKIYLATKKLAKIYVG
jgi:hypothetical protein